MNQVIDVLVHSPLLSNKRFTKNINLRGEAGCVGDLERVGDLDWAGLEVLVVVLPDNTD